LLSTTAYFVKMRKHPRRLRQSSRPPLPRPIQALRAEAVKASRADRAEKRIFELYKSYY
jgi:hypothetical protein